MPPYLNIFNIFVSVKKAFHRIMYSKSYRRANANTSDWWLNLGKGCVLGFSMLYFIT